MKRLSAVGFAAVACLAAPAVMANPTASASLGNLQVLIFDLTPGDGITPTFMITSPFSAAVYSNLETGESDFQSSGLNLSSSLASPLASAGATLVGGAALGSFMVTSTASSNGSVVTDAPDASSGSFVSFDVRFSPNSVLVLTGDVFASASGASTANASADGGAYLVLYEAAGGSFGSGQIWAQSYLGTPSANKSGTASASLVNTTGGDLTVVAYGQTYAVAQATPVAEPGSYVLLVAGLLAIGTVVRRRG